MKVSRIINLDDATFAVRCGVDALGFLFAGESPRSIQLDACARIIKELPSHITKVGEFVGANRQYVQGVVSKVNLSAVQMILSISRQV